MRAVRSKAIVFLGVLVCIGFTSGCTDWKKKYEALNVEHQNLKGLYERDLAEKGQLADEVTQGQQAIAELQKKIDQLKQSPAQASGFGEGYDVKFDASAGTVTVTLKDSILFDSGKAVLRKSTSAELDHIYSVLKSQYAGRQVDVVGHTDTDPIKKSPWKDNWELSAQRALSVVRYLVDKGVSEEKIRAVGRGASQPIDSNASASGKSRNRRVEIVVHMR